ncbi:MAG: hypothetical protein QOF01_4955 [Thermomicrobiales bacterium]|jgi:hypothetical protein|nr:hypothetical protein [Thermomicrobiales bacterium]MEA2529280.1 hypothetical protein [Thermomicrobiales bacterium]MEA2598486.1 hypothetical protein [Thermomicrobiales bacterium]
MPDQELIDGLIATYRTLNMSVRPLPEEKLRVASANGGSVRDALRRLRDDELKFSQALKVRVTTGQPMPEVSEEEKAVIGTESEDDTTAALLAQFGTARESSLAMLRGLPDAEWDSTEAGPRTIRDIIRDLVANDQRRLQGITALLGGR